MTPEAPMATPVGMLLGRPPGAPIRPDRKIGSDLGDLSPLSGAISISRLAPTSATISLAVAPARDALMPLWQTKLDVVAQVKTTSLDDVASGSCFPEDIRF